MCQSGWEWGWRRMDTYICMAESLHCSPETTTTLLLAIPQYKIQIQYKIKNLKFGKKIVHKKHQVRNAH